MMLIIFPLKHENPFSIKVEVGKLIKFNENTWILCTGMGFQGAERLGRILSENPNLNLIVEFGTAANINGGKIGQLYECTTFFDINGEVLGNSRKITNLQSAGVTSENRLFSGEKYEWVENYDLPILFTMETLIFRKIIQDFRKEFFSIRLVTDSGIGDIKKQIMKLLESSRKDVKKIFNLILDSR